jgi:site-specific DNA-adenine methylase
MELWTFKFLDGSDKNSNEPSKKINDIMLTVFLCNEEFSGDDNAYSEFEKENPPTLPEKQYTFTLWSQLFRYLHCSYVQSAQLKAEEEYDDEYIRNNGKVSAKTKAKLTVEIPDNIFLNRLLTDAITQKQLLSYDPYKHLDSLTPPYKFTGHKNPRMCKKTKEILKSVITKPNQKESIFNRPNMTYVEPFMGAASLFFSLPIQDGWTYILSDLDKHKVNLLRVIRDSPYEMMDILLNRDYFIEKYAMLKEENDGEIIKHKNPKKDLLNERIRRMNNEYLLTHDDIQNYDNNSRAKSAADFFLLRHHSQIAPSNAELFYRRVAEIPLLGLKLRTAKADIVFSDALSIMKSYNSPNTIQLLDPPYVGSEIMCSSKAIDYWAELFMTIYEKDNRDYFEDENKMIDSKPESKKKSEVKPTKIKKRKKRAELEEETRLFHREMATIMVNMKRVGCEFIYFCRSTARRKEDGDSKRTKRSVEIQKKLDKLFNDRGFHIDWLVLDKKATECFITSFEHRDEHGFGSEPYIDGISTYLPKDEVELKEAMNIQKNNNY